MNLRDRCVRGIVVKGRSNILNNGRIPNILSVKQIATDDFSSFFVEVALKKMREVADVLTFSMKLFPF